MDEDDLRLGDAIKRLRAELEDAQNEGADKKIRFLPKAVEVEMNLVLKSEKGGEVGVKAWFVTASGKVSLADEATTKLKLTLTPVDPQGRPTLVSDAELEDDSPAG